MSTDTAVTAPDQTWSRGEIAGAVLLGLLALGLGYIAADILIGGRFGFRKGCCDDTEEEAGS